MATLDDYHRTFWRQWAKESFPAFREAEGDDEGPLNLRRALALAREGLEKAKARGDKPQEAVALLTLASANYASLAALNAATEALKLFRSLEDKLGEGYAGLVLAHTYLAQARRQFSQGLAAAQEALAVFKSKGDKRGQAIAAGAVSFAHMVKEEGQESERAARDSLALFREAGDQSGEAYAAALLHNSRLVSLVPTNAQLYFDEHSCAHLALTELATQESLEAAIAALHSWHLSTQGSKTIKSIVMHLEGAPGPEGLHSYAISSGAFLVGLRSVGLPVVLAASGKIAGPSWGLLLACDYRVAAANTEFILPVWGAPQCLQELVGPAAAAQLCLNEGSVSAVALLELGLLNQVQKGKDDAEKAASEMAKRIATFPTIACRQTMSLMCPHAEKYAMATAEAALLKV